jgi:hypothetical protein
MISIISIVNNYAIAKEFLLQGLSRQNAPYDFILLDNKDSSYRSAAQAYNEGSAKAKGDYLMFIHQDVFLPSSTWLRDAEQSLSTISNLGIAGVAGMLQPTFISDFEICARYYLLESLNLSKVWWHRYGRGNVFHGREKRPSLGKFVSKVITTKTLDELLLIVPAKVFEKAKFDEITCDDWHLYGVDYSLSAAQKSLDVCVLPQSVIHLSSGKVSNAYFETLMKIIKKHQTEKIINTTMRPWSTRPKLVEMQIHHFFSKGWRSRKLK